MLLNVLLAEFVVAPYKSSYRIFFDAEEI